jgi:hypothetical protein
MRPGREIGRVCPCSGEVKDERGCTSAPTICLSVCLACADNFNVFTAQKLVQDGSLVVV